jgi:hypothetical protein
MEQFLARIPDDWESLTEEQQQAWAEKVIASLAGEDREQPGPARREQPGDNEKP